MNKFNGHFDVFGNGIAPGQQKLDKFQLIWYKIDP